MLAAYARQDSISHKKRIVFYNVENLFYPGDDSLKMDDDFTPGGSYHWTFRRYFQKLNKLAKVIISLSETDHPVLIGLCEIENRRVLEDLTQRTLIKSFGYRIIHQESDDPRGIDVALLYDPVVFIPEKYSSIKIFNIDSTLVPTRSILKVTGSFMGKHRCHIFVNHWPSRRGGQKVSEPRRILVASHLKREIERIYLEELMPNIIIMGDFNDEPVDKSIRNVLHAGENKNQTEDSTKLINVMFDLYRKGSGSYFRKNNFPEASLIDQFIVSGAILNGENGIKIVEDGTEIYIRDFLIDEKNGMPLRSFQGLKYLGGISDHFPVLIEINFTNVDE
jgi:hypothetical protein